MNLPDIIYYQRKLLKNTLIFIITAIEKRKEGLTRVLVQFFLDAKSNKYDLEILDSRATIQDYLDAINKFIETNMTKPCRGCDECCWERIPLTSIDVLNYKKSNLLDFLKSNCYVHVEGRVVDISLGFTLEGACAFLDQTQRICTNYAARSLVCQSFICLQSSGRAQDIRSELVNAGMDELVKLWLTKLKNSGQKPFIHEAHNPCPDLRDYPMNGFSNKKHYNQVLIKEVCSKELWHQLFVGKS